jgi:ABC-type nitrate/sulfonate/bicarbonate transport system permease component
MLTVLQLLQNVYTSSGVIDISIAIAIAIAIAIVIVILKNKNTHDAMMRIVSFRFI